MGGVFESGQERCELRFKLSKTDNDGREICNGVRESRLSFVV